MITDIVDYLILLSDLQVGFVFLRNAENSTILVVKHELKKRAENKATLGIEIG
jgi:hypothetical protein